MRHIVHLLTPFIHASLNEALHTLILSASKYIKEPDRETGSQCGPGSQCAGTLNCEEQMKLNQLTRGQIYKRFRIG